MKFGFARWIAIRIGAPGRWSRKIGMWRLDRSAPRAKVEADGFNESRTPRSHWYRHVVMGGWRTRSSTASLLLCLPPSRRRQLGADLDRTILPLGSPGSLARDGRAERRYRDSGISKSLGAARFRSRNDPRSAGFAPD
jgi:hypothetical protein